MVHVFIYLSRAKNFVMPNEMMTEMNLRRKETFKETPFSIRQKLISKEDIKTTTVCFAFKNVQQEGASIFIPSKLNLKVHQNNVGFSSIKTMSKKAC